MSFYFDVFEIPAPLVFGFTPISLPVSLLHHTWNNHLHLFSSQLLFVLLLKVCFLFFAHGRGIPVKVITEGFSCVLVPFVSCLLWVPVTLVSAEAQTSQHLHSHLRVVLFNKSLNHSAGTGVAPKEGERWQHWESKTESISERGQEWASSLQG